MQLSLEKNHESLSDNKESLLFYESNYDPFDHNHRFIELLQNDNFAKSLAAEFDFNKSALELGRFNFLDFTKKNLHINDICLQSFLISWSEYITTHAQTAEKCQ